MAVFNFQSNHMALTFSLINTRFLLILDNLKFMSPENFKLNLLLKSKSRILSSLHSSGTF